jgi:hypothetical protein
MLSQHQLFRQGPPLNIPTAAHEPTVGGLYGCHLRDNRAQFTAWINQTGADTSTGTLRLLCSKSKGKLKPWWWFRIKESDGEVNKNCDNHPKYPRASAERDKKPYAQYIR